MKRTSLLSVTSVFLFFLTIPAQSGFLSNYSDWKKVTPEFRFGYVAAIYDHQVLLLYNDSQSAINFRNARQKCGEDLKLTPSIIVDAIDNEYKTKPENWSEPPLTLFFKVLGSACKSFHNDYQKNE
jgi:hypothetical protein